MEGAKEAELEINACKEKEKVQSKYIVLTDKDINTLVRTLEGQACTHMQAD